MGIGSRREDLEGDWSAAWRHLPLCRKYLALRIRSSLPSCTAKQPVTASWSVGVSEEVWLEIAGPWMSIGRDPSDPLAILHDLQRRGVERFPRGLGGAPCTRLAPLPPLSELMASAMSKPRGRGLRLLVNSAVRMVDGRVARTLARRTSFADAEQVRLAVDRTLCRAQREFNALRDALPGEPQV